MPIFYDVEIFGGISVTGEVLAEDGHIAGFTLPDGTKLETSVAGGVYGTHCTQKKVIGDAILEAIRGCYDVMEAVDKTRIHNPHRGADRMTPPIRIDWRVG